MENIEVKKMNFLKKIWYSIAKPSKYEDMKNEGVGTSLKYFLGLIGILCLIVAIVATIIQTNVIKNATNYLNEKLPEMTFKENKLTVESEEATILNDDAFLLYFARNVVINPLLEEEEAIKEYYKLSQNKYKTVIFLNDEMITITDKYDPESSSKEGISINKYSDGIAFLQLDSSKQYQKKDIINMLAGKVSYISYIIQYLIAYIIMIGLLYAMYVIIISLVMWGMTKILKINWGFKNSLMNTIYSSTLSCIVFVLYMLISYFTKIRIPYIDVITIFLIFIYIFLLLYKDRRSLIKTK